MRGSHPIDQKGSFVYDQILSAVKAQQPSIDLTGYSLVDVSMIDNRPDGDMPNLNHELVAYGLDSAAAMTKVLSVTPVNEHYTVLIHDYKAWVDSTGSHFRN